MIIETFPRCGAALQSTVICTNPPIPCKNCNPCGWHWGGGGKPELVEYVPFWGNKENSMDELKLYQAYSHRVHGACCDYPDLYGGMVFHEIKMRKSE